MLYFFVGCNASVRGTSYVRHFRGLTRIFKDHVRTAGVTKYYQRHIALSSIPIVFKPMGESSSNPCREIQRSLSNQSANGLPKHYIKREKKCQDADCKSPWKTPTDRVEVSANPSTSYSKHSRNPSKTYSRKTAKPHGKGGKPIKATIWGTFGQLCAIFGHFCDCRSICESPKSVSECLRIRLTATPKTHEIRLDPTHGNVKNSAKGGRYL